MTPFIIVADLRTGSTLLQSSLNEHPQIRCLGELFHPEALPDNTPPGIDRFALSGRELIDAAFSGRDVAAAGFRAMVFLPLPSHPQWSDAWDVLRQTPKLRVIYLARRDLLAQYASVRVADHLKVWHPSPGDPALRPENRPKLTIAPDELRRWIREREALFALRRAQLEGLPSLELDYETLTGSWTSSVQRTLDFLGVPAVPLAPSRGKQETRDLAEFIENYQELRRTMTEG
jgi:LPS sulfotransferase NodH